ncbi:MAG: response regulator, partial [Candidatus Saccharicenans sp.]
MAKKKILLIDFDQEFLKFLTKALSDEGYEIITAADGLAGFEKFAEIHPDLVIMEAMLPKFHGFELCSRITSHPTKRAPVIIVTGIYKDSVYKTEALRSLGASGFFEKPLNLPELLTKIHELIGKPEVKKAVSTAEADLDKLLKEALSLEKEAPKPAEKAKPQERPVKKPEPFKETLKINDDEVDMILRSKLKDLISEQSIPEVQAPAKTMSKPEKERVVPKAPEPKKVAPAAEAITEMAKKPAPATVLKAQPTMAEAKEEARPVSKKEPEPAFKV